MEIRSPFVTLLSFFAPLTLVIGVVACGQSEHRLDLGSGPALSGFHPAIRSHVEFLSAHAEDPVTYVSRLLNDHDLVILCERAHPEATQYEFYLALLEDERVGGRIVNVFTELGSRNLQPAIDEILGDPSLSDVEARRRLLHLYRDLTFRPTWTNTNFYDFLLGVRELNRSRPPESRVRVVFSDVEFSWEGLDRAGYRAFRDGLAVRDRSMAERIIEELRAAGPGSKALAILNFRHAFNDFTFDDGSKGENVGRYLFEAFPGRVANAMMNALAVRPGSTDREPVLEPIQDGRWDAAFRVLGLQAAGFDFRGSAFGAEQFDYYPSRTQTVTYEDVFDGFIFYRPLTEHVFRRPVPGFVDEAFLPELRRRFDVAGLALGEGDLEELLAASPTESRYESLEDIEARIAAWID